MCRCGCAYEQEFEYEYHSTEAEKVRDEFHELDSETPSRTHQSTRCGNDSSAHVSSNELSTGGLGL